MEPNCHFFDALLKENLKYYFFSSEPAERLVQIKMSTHKILLLVNDIFEFICYKNSQNVYSHSLSFMHRPRQPNCCVKCKALTANALSTLAFYQTARMLWRKRKIQWHVRWHTKNMT